MDQVTRPKRYQHDFNDGDIVTDTEYNETFVFSDRTDGFRAQQNPGKLRLATEEEKKNVQ